MARRWLSGGGDGGAQAGDAGPGSGRPQSREGRRAGPTRREAGSQGSSPAPAEAGGTVAQRRGLRTALCFRVHGSTPRRFGQRPGQRCSVSAASDASEPGDEPTDASPPWASGGKTAHGYVTCDSQAPRGHGAESGPAGDSCPNTVNATSLSLQSTCCVPGGEVGRGRLPAGPSATRSVSVSTCMRLRPRGRPPGQGALPVHS